VVTIFLCVNVVFKNLCWLFWRKSLGRNGINDGVFNTNLWQFILLEVALNLISPMPFLHDVEYTDYYYVEDVNVKIHLNTALFVIMVLCRVYHVESCVLISTYYMSDRAYRVSLIYGRALGYSFALKSIYKTHPFIL
jgi:hypothetical protein